jgi:hypothetical protein
MQTFSTEVQQIPFKSFTDKMSGQMFKRKNVEQRSGLSGAWILTNSILSSVSV